MKKSLLFLMFILTSIGLSQPNPPDNLTASIKYWVNFKYIQLNWDEVKSASGYIIYKKMEADSEYFQLPMPTRHNYFKDKLVLPGYNYSYFVTAINRNGESQPSDTVEIEITDSTTSGFVEGYLSDEATGLKLNQGSVVLFPMMGWHSYKINIDSTGYFKKEIKTGKYFVFYMANKYYPEFYNNASNIMEAEQITIEENQILDLSAGLNQFIIPAPRKLSGKVSDSSGTPIKARIAVYVLNRNFFRKHFHNAETNDSGYYSVPVREGDSVIVFALPKDRRYIPEFYNNKKELAEADKVYINGNAANIDFILESRPAYDNSISGVVKNQDGVGVNANVTLLKLRDQRHARYKSTVMTDSLGNYSFTNLAPGKYILFTIPEEGYLPTFFKYDSTQTFRWKQADSVEVSENSKITGIDFIVLPIPDSGLASIGGTISDNSGNGVNGAIIYAINENSEIAAYSTSDENGSYILNNIAPGKYIITTDKFSYDGSTLNDVTVDYQTNLYRTVQLNLTPVSTTSTKTIKLKITDYKLNQNYPNPFNPVTTINYQIPEAVHVVLKVFNIIGQEIKTLVNEHKQPGSYNVTFDASELNSGIYIYKMQAGSTIITKKMTVIK